jgi:hypothetical protein
MPWGRSLCIRFSNLSSVTIRTPYGYPYGKRGIMVIHFFGLPSTPLFDLVPLGTSTEGTGNPTFWITNSILCLKEQTTHACQCAWARRLCVHVDRFRAYMYICKYIYIYTCERGSVPVSGLWCCWCCVFGLQKERLHSHWPPPQPRSLAWGGLVKVLYSHARVLESAFSFT